MRSIATCGQSVLLPSRGENMKDSECMRWHHGLKMRVQSTQDATTLCLAFFCLDLSLSMSLSHRRAAIATSLWSSWLPCLYYNTESHFILMEEKRWRRGVQTGLACRRL